MKEPIEDIRSKLRNNVYKNKEQVRISIVGRMLHNLGWDLWNPNEVFPDYTISSASQACFDLALFVNQNAPSLFIDIDTNYSCDSDAKKIEQQLHEYNGDINNLLLLQTNGQQWNFYFSDTEEELTLKHIKTLDILADNIDELIATFDMYLSKNNIKNGNALSEARNIIMQSKLEAAVVEVLDKARLMVTEPPYPRLPQAVIELLITKGLTITENEVITYLKKIEAKKTIAASTPAPEITPEKEFFVSQESDPVSEQETAPENEPESQSEPEIQLISESESEPETETEKIQEPETAAEESNKNEGVNKELTSAKAIKIDFTNKQIKKFIFLGKIYTPKSWKEMLIIFCEIIYKLHKNEYYKCLTLRTANQRYFSKNKNEFFGNSPVQIEETEYWVMTNMNANQIVKLIYKMMDLFMYKIKDIEIVTD
ncbi:MAG: hypothetical protein JXB48_10695 [Candidatus Latescibacteria bacterium]|nr:hypothetical protein [Candidatus Latescibacterota bacterium]